MRIILVWLVVLIYAYAGQADRLQVNLNTDEDGNTNPDLFIPVYWSDTLFSGVGYYSSSSYETGNVNGGIIVDSRVGTTTDEKRFKLNLISYEMKTGAMTYALGADYEQITIDKHEFGYLDYTSDVSAVENNIEIDVVRTNLNADATYRTNSLYARLGLSLSPSSTLSVDQTTVVKPLLSGTGTSSSSNSQEMSYDIAFKGGYKLSPLMTLIVQGIHSYLPLKYDLAVAGSGSTFVVQEQDTEQTTTKSMVKLAFNLDAFSKELSPSIGFGSESVAMTDNNEDETDTVTNSLVMIGFEGRF